jgi:hypothetical protein
VSERRRPVDYFKVWTKMNNGVSGYTSWQGLSLAKAEEVAASERAKPYVVAVEIRKCASLGDMIARPTKP